MKDYAALQLAIDDQLDGLDSDGKALDEALDLLVDAEDMWEEQYDDFLDRLTNEYANSSKRLPGEDVRMSMCRQENRETWQTFKRAERAKEKLEKRLTRRRAALSALQSQLSAAKEEAKGSHSGAQPQWTGSAA